MHKHLYEFKILICILEKSICRKTFLVVTKSQTNKKKTLFNFVPNLNFISVIFFM